MIYKTKSDGNLFKELRRKTGFSQYAVADRLNIKQNTVSAWERGVAIPDQALLPRIAELYGTTVDYLLTGKEPVYKPASNAIPNPRFTKRVPLLGSIAAGNPRFAIENNDIESYVFVDESVGNGDFFAVTVHGDSMEPRICEGDIAVIRIQPEVENGTIAAVKVNGESVTLKVFRKLDNGVSLVGLNPRFVPLFYSAKEVETLPITIMGKIVRLISNF